MSESTTCGSSACAAGGCQSTASSAKSVKNGKGSAPRSISKKFLSNYNQIKWSHGGKKRREGHREVVVYS